MLVQKWSKKCQLASMKFKTSWLVQLATGEKHRVTAKVENFLMEIARQSIKVNLNILPLGSYDVLIRMD